MLATAAVGLVGAGGATAAPAPSPQPRVTIAVVPRGIDVAAIADASPEIAPGLLSAGLGRVDPDQTYLDVTQGTRLFTSLYPEDLPPLYIRGSKVPRRYWRIAVRRAEDAPAELVPGLLAAALEDGGVPIGAARGAEAPELMTVNPDGVMVHNRDCEAGSCPGVTVTTVELPGVSRLAAGLEGDDLLIVLERPPPADRLLAVGIAGAGFEGNLTSSTTRTEGYVLSTDLAPTILSRYGLPIPPQMAGEPITAEGARDPAAVEDLGERFADVVDRRGPVMGANLAIWVGLTLIVGLAWRPRARFAAALLATALAWAPGVLVVTGPAQMPLIAERLVVGLGTPLLAAAAILALGRLGPRRAPLAAFALGALISVGIVAVDVVLGSTLTASSLIGPNPGIGVRFYGIGNELEATIAALICLGSGAAVTALRPADPRRAVVVTAVVAALLAVVAFAPGQFGADVGAAITIPAGVAALAIAALGAGRRRIVWIVAAPVLALAALVAIDLIAGGDSHFSRSVLGAGGLDELGEVLERRIRLGAASFDRYSDSIYFILAVATLLAGVVAHRRILGWLEDRPAARAGFIGAVASTVVGTLANDSGALLLIIGAVFLAAFAVLAWATRSEPGTL